MRFTCTIDMDNAAFEDNLEPELTACLQRVIACVNNDLDWAPIVDSNGNVVGEWAYRTEEF